MAYTQDQANAYYNTLSAEQKAAVDASGGPSIAWFTNSVNAGVPDAVTAAGGRTGSPEGAPGQHEIEGGSYIEPDGTEAPASEWMGKRKPTPRELRAWARDQHQQYISGNRDAQDEDYQRYSDRQLAAWIDTAWDVGRGGFFTTTGKRIGKPTESGGDGSWAPGYGVGEEYGWTEAMARGAAAGGGGGGGGKPAAPPKPTTFGSQLSLTGNPTVDMLIHQFNTRTNLEGTQTNIFGLGEDRRPGGEGAAADDAKVKGQLLAGGGLWWGQQGFNKGFRADKEQKQATGGGGGGGGGGRGGRGGGGGQPSPQEIAAPPPPATPTPDAGGGLKLPAYKQDMLYGGNPMSDMLDRRFTKGYGRLTEY